MAPCQFKKVQQWNPSVSRHWSFPSLAAAQQTAAMGGHFCRKWYKFTTGDPEIDRYGWIYGLVIENVDRCNWDYRLVIENVDRYGWDYLLLIENNGRSGPKTYWISRLTIPIVRKKIGVKMIIQRLTIQNVYRYDREIDL